MIPSLRKPNEKLDEDASNLLAHKLSDRINDELKKSSDIEDVKPEHNS